MDQVQIQRVDRLDHLGLVAGVIQELGLIELVDERIPPDEQETITTGQAIAGMILNGLGFSNRPLSLTPQYFGDKPLDVLFGEGIKAEHFNRFKLGRSLDKVYRYGCDLLFSEIALSVCHKQGVEVRFNSLDTTSFALTGEYVPESDEQAILVTHGYSKDHRPDLKQAILELMVSSDGGVPLVSQSWDGNASDHEIFKRRTKALLTAFEKAEGPRYLIAGSKLYTQENATYLAQIPFITRIPKTLQVENQVIAQAWSFNEWKPLAEGYRYQAVQLGHYGMAQRWPVIHSQAAWQRAEVILTKARDKEYKKVQIQAKRFNSEERAQAAFVGLFDCPKTITKPVERDSADHS